MNNIYKKSEITFAILWIVLYIVSLSIADNISTAIGIEKLITLPVCIVLATILMIWIYKNGHLGKYGLCASRVPASQLLFYIPLALLISVNLWFGVSMNLTILETVLYVLSMLFVGFLEEIIFRGLLFQAMCKDDVKTAIIVSSVTFGIGHIVNLFNGSGADLFSNLLQVCYAIAAGFLFTILFYKTKSLWACIITHGVLNALSVFANEAAMTPLKEGITAIALIVISMAYAIFISRKRE